MVYMSFTVLSIINLEIRAYRRMCACSCADAILFKVLNHLEIFVSMVPRTSSLWMLTPKDNCAHPWAHGVSKGACHLMEQHQLPAGYVLWS